MRFINLLNQLLTKSFLSLRPTDIARLNFFQFIQVNMGQSVMEVITLNGWPGKDEWVKWEAWWDKESNGVAEDMTRRGEKGLSTKWPFKAKRLADIIIHAVNEMNVIAVENMTQWSVEKWMWRVNLIKNALIELKILPWPIPRETNWFTRINGAGN